MWQRKQNLALSIVVVGMVLASYGSTLSITESQAISSQSTTSQSQKKDIPYSLCRDTGLIYLTYQMSFNKIVKNEFLAVEDISSIASHVSHCADIPNVSVSRN